MLVGVGLALLAAAPKAALPPAPPAHDLGSIASPYGDPSLGPPLVGPSSQLDVATLATLETEYTLAADLSVLSRINEENKSAIVGQLARDPRWRVSEEDRVIVAVPRVSDGQGGWRAVWAGYHKTPTQAWRVAIRFGSPPPTSPWAVAPVVARARAKDPQIRVKGFQPRGLPGLTAAALSWSSEGAAIELFEASKGDDLGHVTQALSEIPSMLARMVDYPTFVVLPTGEPKVGEPQAAMTVAGRMLDVSARVHPSEPGVTWARVLDGQLRPWEEAAIAAGTRERIGWSSDPKQLWYLQGAFPVPAGASFSGTLEIWFQADGGAAPERLLASPIKVPKRV